MTKVIVDREPSEEAVEVAMEHEFATDPRGSADGMKAALRSYTADAPSVDEVVGVLQTAVWSMVSDDPDNPAIDEVQALLTKLRGE